MSLANLRCIVVDDEPPAIKLLESYINQTPALKWLKSFTRPLEALSWLTKNTTDIIFLDISMPEMNGLDFAQSIKGKAKVILCTAYREYGAESYEYSISDYLVKPVSYARFLAAVQRIIDASKVSPLKEQPDFIMVPGTGRYNRIKINFEDILFVSANKNHVVIHLAKEKKEAFISLKEIETLLPSRNFIRVHLSYIVGIHKIARLDKSTVLLKNCPEIIPIGITYRESLYETLNIRDDF